MNELNEKKLQIIQAVTGKYKRLKEIAKEVNLANSTVYQHLMELSVKGYIIRAEVKNSGSVYYTST